VLLRLKRVALVCCLMRRHPPAFSRIPPFVPGSLVFFVGFRYEFLVWLVVGLVVVSLVFFFLVFFVFFFLLGFFFGGFGWCFGWVPCCVCFVSFLPVFVPDFDGSCIYLSHAARLQSPYHMIDGG